MSERMLHARPIPVNRVVGSIADRALVFHSFVRMLNRQLYDRCASEYAAVRQKALRRRFLGRRLRCKLDPFSVVRVIADDFIGPIQASGPHLIEFTPAGTMLSYLAMSIGARSQSARTYLERHLSEFAACDAEGLIQHGLKALRETLQQDKDLTVDNTSIVCSSFLYMCGTVPCLMLPFFRASSHLRLRQSKQLSGPPSKPAPSYKRRPKPCPNSAAKRTFAFLKATS